MKVLLLLSTLTGNNISAKEYHVAKYGDDKNSGSHDAPFMTIQAAAILAQAGDNYSTKVHTANVLTPREEAKAMRNE
jgi:hypothetical protein